MTGISASDQPPTFFRDDKISNYHSITLKPLKHDDMIILVNSVLGSKDHRFYPMPDFLIF